MKRKEDAETRREQESVQQRAVERTHWTVEDLPKTAGTRPRFQVEYDLSASTSAVQGRQSYCNYNKTTPAQDPKTVGDEEMAQLRGKRDRPK